MNKRWSPFLIMLAAILWSADGVLRRQLYALPPATVVMLEHAFGVLIALPFLPKVIHEYKKMTKKDWLVMLTITVFASVLGTIFYTAALGKVNYINYSVVVLLQQTQPIFAIALAGLLLKEALTKKYLIQAVIGLAAAYFLAFPSLRPNVLGLSGETSAAMLAMGAAIAWGSATVLGKLILKTLSFKAAAILRFALAIPIAYLVAVLSGQTYPLSAVTTSQWLSLLGIALSSGMVAFLIYYKGLSGTPAKVSTLVELTWPVSAAFIGLLFFKEVLTPVQLVAGVVLLADIVTLVLRTRS
ncbi:MAG TPA: DMT family transporter [Patescibacteria group bacterium]|nr:DMT family transporter [Patescibacteria group bacterium]